MSSSRPQTASEAAAAAATSPRARIVGTQAVGDVSSPRMIVPNRPAQPSSLHTRPRQTQHDRRRTNQRIINTASRLREVPKNPAQFDHAGKRPLRQQDAPRVIKMDAKGQPLSFITAPFERPFQGSEAKVDAVRLSEEALKPSQLRSAGSRKRKATTATTAVISKERATTAALDSSNVRSVLQEGSSGAKLDSSPRGLPASNFFIDHPNDPTQHPEDIVKNPKKYKNAGSVAQRPPFLRIPFSRRNVNSAPSSDAGESEQGHQQLEITGSRPHTVQDQSSFAQNKQRVATKPERTQPKRRMPPHLARKLKSTISDGCPDWMHIPHVPVLPGRFWRGKRLKIVGKNDPKCTSSRLEFPPSVGKGGLATQTSEVAPEWMHCAGATMQAFRKPEPISVKNAYETAHAKAIGPKAPIRFNHWRPPHRQTIVRDNRNVKTACGKYNARLTHASMISAEAPDFFRAGEHGAEMLLQPTPRPPVSAGVHMPSLRPYTALDIEDGKVRRKSESPRHNGSVSYDGPQWFKIPGVRVKNGPYDDLKQFVTMKVGPNRAILADKTELKIAKDIISGKVEAHRQDNAIEMSQKSAHSREPQRTVKMSTDFETPAALFLGGKGENGQGMRRHLVQIESAAEPASNKKV